MEERSLSTHTPLVMPDMTSHTSTHTQTHTWSQLVLIGLHVVLCGEKQRREHNRNESVHSDAMLRCYAKTFRHDAMLRCYAKGSGVMMLWTQLHGSKEGVTLVVFKIRGYL